MTPERWQEVKKVLAGVLERPPEERGVYLDQACTEPALRREVESLIAAHEQGDSSFLEHATLTGEPLQKGSKLGQYTILACIGAGGMGEVYRARDNRLNRDVAIKVLPSFFSDDPDRLRRFEQEARAAAALNHPNILAVFQMGTYEDAPYLVSELLEGSTLREQLKRGPMPLRRVVDCGVQIAHGLAAAHDKGIVHRDLKPENLFVTKDGRVKILDFGLAKLTQRAWTPDSNVPTVSDVTEPGAVMGTVGYMSPEQVSGKVADHRADIFALGAILYEMVTGKRAFQKPTSAETMSAILNEDPQGLSQLAPTAPSALQRVVQRCLEKNPEQRFQSASDLAFALEALSESSSASAAAIARPASRRRWLWAAAVLTLVVLGLVTGGYLYLHRTPVLTEKDSIVLADFTNTTGDPVFDGTLRQGLSVQLQQTPFLTVVSGDQVTQTLRMMEQPLDARLTPSLAREVCQRTNATAVVDGSIATLGNQYVLGLNAVNCTTGETLAQEQVTADGKEKVLPALSGAASELRSKLGESQASLKAYDVPLEQATTSSLEALQAYNQGEQALWRGDTQSGISALQRAIDLDPSFAMAYSLLGTVYGLAGNNDLDVKNAKKAYELRDRASEYERLKISGYYNFSVTRDLEKAAPFYAQWAKTYPRDPRAWTGLGICFAQLGRYDQSLSSFLEALRFSPSPFAYGMLGFNYVVLNHFDQARATIQSARAKHIEPYQASAMLYVLAFLRGDQAEMTEQTAHAWTYMPPGASEDAQGLTAAYGGHLSLARHWTRRAISSATSAQLPNVVEGLKVESGLREALLGNLEEARKEVQEVIAATTDPDLQGSAALALALSGDPAEAQKLADDLTQRSPEATSVRFDYLPAIQAAIALKQGDPQKAIDSLSAAASYELLPGPAIPMTPVYLRGQAYLAAHEGPEAAAEFGKILAHRGLVGNAPTGALAHLGLARAYALQGKRAEARTAYQDFLALWKDADPDIPIFKQAKAEYAQLQ